MRAESFNNDNNSEIGMRAQHRAHGDIYGSLKNVRPNRKKKSVSLECDDGILYVCIHITHRALFSSVQYSESDSVFVVLSTFCSFSVCCSVSSSYFHRLCWAFKPMLHTLDSVVLHLNCFQKNARAHKKKRTTKRKKQKPTQPQNRPAGLCFHQHWSLWIDVRSYDTLNSKFCIFVKTYFVHENGSKWRSKRNIR